MDTRPIGIFDSGIGGLTVADEIMKAMPGEDIVYFGDRARVPYGSRSVETLCRYGVQNVNFLLSKDVKLIVIACGSSSSNSYGFLAERFSIPFVEMIAPGVEACLEATKNNIVGVIGTAATVRSGLHAKLMRERHPDIKVYTKGCPLLVSLAEEGWIGNNAARATAEIYLREMIDKKIDSLLLACTHFPLFTECIKEIAGDISIVNPAVAVAARVKEYLAGNSMLSGKETAEHQFYVSGSTDTFGRICGMALGKEYEASLIDIEEY